MAFYVVKIDSFVKAIGISEEIIIKSKGNKDEIDKISNKDETKNKETIKIK